jgi:hypothetical protein
MSIYPGLSQVALGSNSVATQLICMLVNIDSIPESGKLPRAIRHIYYFI